MRAALAEIVCGHLSFVLKSEMRLMLKGNRYLSLVSLDSKPLPGKLGTARSSGRRIVCKFFIANVSPDYEQHHGERQTDASVRASWSGEVAAHTALLRSCLSTDLTTLNNYNWKLSYVPFKNNRLNFQNTWAEKVRNARDASDTRPIETTYRQKAVSSDFGQFGWLADCEPDFRDCTNSHHGDARSE